MSQMDISDTFANAALDAMPSLNSGIIRGYTGSSPGIGSAATGTLLFTLAFNATAFAAASSRQRVANAIADAAAAADGTLGYVRILTSGAAAVADIKGGGSWITTFSSSTGLLGTTNVAHGLSNGDAVEVFAEGAGVLPTGLAANTTYYVLSASGSTLKFESSLGGGAIAYTDAGSGTLRLKRAEVGFALQSATGGVLAGIGVGVSQMAVRIPNVDVG